MYEFDGVLERVTTLSRVDDGHNSEREIERENRKKYNRCTSSLTFFYALSHHEVKLDLEDLPIGS